MGRRAALIAPKGVDELVMVDAEGESVRVRRFGSRGAEGETGLAKSSV